jgi:hypothetical protein
MVVNENDITQCIKLIAMTIELPIFIVTDTNINQQTCHSQEIPIYT